MKKLATLISYVFHPLLMMTLITVFSVWFYPYAFGSIRTLDQLPLFLMVFFSTFIVPGIIILMLKGLGLVESIEMKTGKERIIPLIGVMVCYFSMFMYMHRDTELPDTVKIAALGICIALTLCFIITIFYKISLHTVGMGGLWLFSLLLCEEYFGEMIHIQLTLPSEMVLVDMPHIIVFSLITIVAGLVAMSRLYLRAHTRHEVYTGFIIGMMGIFISYLYYTG